MPGLLEQLHNERTLLLDQVDEITSRAEAEERDLSDSDRELIHRHHSRIDVIDPQIEDCEAMEVRRAKHAERLPVPRRTDVNVPDAQPAPAGEMVYRTFAQYARDELVRRYDAIAQLAGGAPARQAAEERISRVVAHTLTSDIGGLLPNQYLSQIVQVIDTSRPIVQSARRVTLTNGKLSYPKIMQKPIVGKQTVEKTEGPSQTMDVVFVDLVADTFIGAGNLSWQAINWSTPDALQLWFDLAAEAYARQTEAAAGSVLGALATGAPPASDDLAGWTAAIAAAAGDIYSQTRMRADTIYADITSGYHLIGMVSNASPVFLSTGQFSLSSGQGNIAGLQLVISPGLAVNNVIVGSSNAVLVAETAGAPVELRAVEPAIGGMEVGVIGAFVTGLTDTGAFTKLGVPV